MAAPLWRGGDTFERGRRVASGSRSSFLFEGEQGAAALPDVVDNRIADPRSFRLATTRVVVGDIALHGVEMTPIASRRSPELIAASPWPSVLLGHARQGRLQIAQDGVANDFGNGELFLVRTDEEFDFSVRQRWVGETLSIAISDLREEGEMLRRSSLAKIGAGHTAAAAALSAIQTTTIARHDTSGAAGQLFELGLVAMIRAAIAQASETPVDPVGRADALRLAIQRYLENHFVDADMSPARVAEAFILSERTLHRLFEGGPSVAARIRMLRTGYLVQALGASALPFDALAARAGFGSAASARRALEEVTGRTSRELRGR